MLPPKRERFCREYIIDLNGKQAAIRAGYSPGKSAEVAAHRLLSDVKIQERIAQLNKKIETKLEIKVEDILKAMLNIVNVDTSKLYHPDGSPRELKDIPLEARNAINVFGGKKFSVSNGDRAKAAEIIMKHLGGGYGIQDQEAKTEDDKPKESGELKYTVNVRPGSGIKYDKGD
jgi:phage terminase small subunit